MHEPCTIPGGAQCRDGRAAVPLRALCGRCGRGSADLLPVSGEELNFKEMEVA